MTWLLFYALGLLSGIFATAAVWSAWWEREKSRPLQEDFPSKHQPTPGRNGREQEDL